MKKIVLVLFLGVWQAFAYGQLVKKVLPRNINIPGKDQMAPSVSGDGRSMIFLTDYTKSGKLELRYAQMTGPGEWSEPEEIPYININRANHFPLGFNLSYDGKTIFFTSRMHYGIGNYDIWYTTKVDGKWTKPKNLGKPVNSRTNDLSPSISPDGRYLYYMRCDRVEGRQVEGCKLMVAERRNATYWNEPVALPAAVNSGQAAFPAILADGRSLIYTSSSSWAPGTHPFFITRNRNGQWSAPRQVIDLGQENTIPFISNSMQGDIIYLSIERKDLDVCMAKLPEAYQPEHVLLLQGKVTDAETKQPLDAYLQVYTPHNGELVNFARTGEEGDFFMPLPADNSYNIAVNAAGNDYTYYSRSFEPDTLNNFSTRDLAIQLERLQPGVSMLLSAIYFDDTGELDERSLLELRRLFKLLRDNAHLEVEIGGYCRNMPDDTLAGIPLAPVVDSLFYTGEPAVLNTDSLTYASVDSLQDQPDPTAGKARAVVAFLVNKGISPDRIVAKGYGEVEVEVDADAAEAQYPDAWLELKVTAIR